MKNKLLFILVILPMQYIISQNYDFQVIKKLEALPVISQDNTGTCWSFSTTSFLESEIFRISGKKIDLSELYQPRMTYPIKAENYVMRQGKAQYGEGALAHDVLFSLLKFGLVPQSAYSGLSDNETKHNHAELFDVSKAFLDVLAQNKQGKLSNHWKKAYENLLNAYIGTPPVNFTFEGKNYTPKTFLEYTKLNPNDYLSIGSFTHEAYYKPFVLNVPDNFSNGKIQNVTLDELVKITDEALEKGFTLAFDADVSEKYWFRNGIAVVPENDEDLDKAKTNIVTEKNVNTELRQKEFENLATTDDHLMHIVGKSKDSKGNEYYVVKNSWGNKSGEDGFWHMSKNYFKLKVLFVVLHKDGIAKDIKQKLIN
jgi:bleomycin hydrolase